MKTSIIATSIIAGIVGSVPAQDTVAPKKADKADTATASAPTPEETAVAAVDRAYEAAFAKGDAKAVADMFTEDAEFTSDEGRLVSGRAAIEAMSKASFQSNKGS